MMDQFWNFSRFYNTAIKGQCSIKQLDAVNILLTGKSFDQFSDLQISASAASKYVNGRKAISKEICARLLRSTEEEIHKRIEQIGIQNYRIGAERIVEKLRSGNLDVASEDVERFELFSQKREYIQLLSAAFILAVKSPTAVEHGSTVEDEPHPTENEQAPLGQVEHASTEKPVYQYQPSNSVLREPEAPILVGREMEDYYKDSRSGNLRIFDSLEDGIFFDHFIRYRMFERRELSDQTTEKLLRFIGASFEDGRFPSISVGIASTFIQYTRKRGHLVCLEACGSIDWIKDRLWAAPIRKDARGFLFSIFTNPETEIAEIDAFYEDAVCHLLPSQREQESLQVEASKSSRYGRSQYAIYEHSLRLHKLKPTIVRLLFWTDEYQYRMYPKVKTSRKII